MPLGRRRTHERQEIRDRVSRPFFDYMESIEERMREWRIAVDSGDETFAAELGAALPNGPEIAEEGLRICEGDRDVHTQLMEEWALGSSSATDGTHPEATPWTPT